MNWGSLIPTWPQSLTLALSQRQVGGLRNGRATVYSFHVTDQGGRIVWSGRDFTTLESRADAISVAHRELVKGGFR